MPPRSRLGFREETQNYAKRNRSQILTCFVYRITSVIINTIKTHYMSYFCFFKRSLLGVKICLITTVKLRVDWSGMVYLPKWKIGFDPSPRLHDLKRLYLSFFTLYSSSLSGTDTIVVFKLNKTPVSIKPPPPQIEDLR